MRDSAQETTPDSAHEALPDTDPEDAIRTLLARLGRSHPSGGVVIERAAILAEGADSAAVIAWITEHAGKPEAAPVSSKGGGLHGSRISDGGTAENRPPARYVLPPGALA